MRPGESKTFAIPWKEAYGPKTLTVEYVKEAFGKDIGALKEGAEYELVPGTKVTISKIGAKTVTATVPATHPLAGEELRYEVSVEENLGSTSEVIVTSPQPKIVGAA
jgi:FKBP-type peptidyl-prolyl cis-trans isomerase 2